MTSRLCVFCRRIEPISQPCSPPWQAGAVQPVTPLSDSEEKMLRDLQTLPSSLCPRCTDYNIIKVFQEAEPENGEWKEAIDRTWTVENNNEYIRLTTEKVKRRGEAVLNLGNLTSLVLSPTCPVCRLIFRIIPREGLGLENDNLKIAPFRSYLQNAGWQKFLGGEHETSGAVLLALESTASLVDHMMGTQDMSGIGRMGRPRLAGESICLASNHVSEGRKVGNARFVGPLANLEFAKRALENCKREHAGFCDVTKPSELQLISLIDVVNRRVVPYHHGCEYLALSYVWGGIMPAPDALETGTLPRTIEDAISVTKTMGFRYLWVDALCIDQSPNPTPEQLVAKQRQLQMMDRIYSSAELTIIAMAGSDSQAGLSGISRSRMSQLQEKVGEYALFTVPPAIPFERLVSIWASRAWTMQEEILSRRHLFFTDTQLEFQCSKARIPESLDTNTLPGWTSPLPTMLDALVTGTYKTSPGTGSPGPNDANLLYVIYWIFTSDYTSRKMSFDGDSLNALLGLLSVWERTLLPTPCLWGLPVSTQPTSLGWFHPRQVIPRRRVNFPSWAWAGWEGSVTIDEVLLPGYLDDPTSRFLDQQLDMEVRFESIDGKEITVEGWVVDLDIKTEPFSEVLDPETGETMGRVVERNFLHATTLPTGRYSCLVISRLKYRITSDGPQYQKVFMVVLQWKGDVAERKTTITLTAVAKGEFMCVKPARKMVRMV
ncbi:heterokaryon incompatibility protein-domain-containing protein [Echria macrotheca]|uniref:Heterokaryon incompatibility protein-domain-containing protein n=1 Tax=Echria macrotheca TaxID=438768 RepID=A0AAJ0FAT5_9PEZI|nr:heterokaryon incompatibility protein-domain-containing protein [Echria macrotheca]